MVGALPSANILSGYWLPIWISKCHLLLDNRLLYSVQSRGKHYFILDPPSAYCWTNKRIITASMLKIPSLVLGKQYWFNLGVSFSLMVPPGPPHGGLEPWRSKNTNLGWGKKYHIVDESSWNIWLIWPFWGWLMWFSWLFFVLPCLHS